MCYLHFITFKFDMSLTLTELHMTFAIACYKDVPLNNMKVNYIFFGKYLCEKGIRT